MNESDKLFEMLGYEKTDLKNMSGKIWGIKYTNNVQFIRIKFDFIEQMVCVASMDGEGVYLTMEELSAINKKCRELGWEQ